MNRDDDLELRKIEAMLLDVGLPEPSSRLDRRIDSLVHGRFNKFAGPSWGFAAGVLLTLGAWRMMAGGAPPPPRTIVKPAAMAEPSVTTRPAPPLQVNVWGEPTQTVDEIDGEVQGVPVKLERTRYGLQMQDAQSGQPVIIQLPESVNMRQMVDY